MNININQLEIPKSTVYATQALQLIAKTETDLSELADIIMQDPLVASALLRYANSPLNRRSSEITNVPTALKILGLKNVRSAIVSATLHALCSDSTHLDKEILRHMLDVSMICRLIAREICRQREYDLEFLGLIHDVGMLVLATNFETQYLELFVKSRQQKIAIDKLEEIEFGTSHNVVSAHLAQEFRLPKSHIDLLRNFHGESGVGDNDCIRDERILCMAHLLLSELTPEESVIYETHTADLPDLQKKLKITDKQVDQLRVSIKDISI